MRGRRRGRHRSGSLTRWSRNESRLGDRHEPVDCTSGKTAAIRGNSNLRIVLWDTRHGGAFKDFAGFEFTPLVDTIYLPAGTSIEVPVRVHNSNVSAGVPGPCGDGNQSVFGEHELSYRLQCGPVRFR